MSVAAEIEPLRLEPDLETARELAVEGNVVPVRLRFVDDCETPVSAFLKLRGGGPAFLLESAEQGQVGRWSFLGFRPRAVLRWSDGTLAEVRERLRGPVPAPETPQLASAPEFVSNMSRERFEGNVERIIEYVHAGDAFQVVPSQRFTAPAPVEAFSVYRGLRTVNPSPYMYFLEFGDFQVAGASPEPLVKVSGRRVETRPIAGTYPRGASEEEDRRQAEALLADPKERAEHLMLVDLGRNDLGRVCEFGSVSVDELMAVETYSHVLHIVSQVSGTLREGVGAIDALRAVLPAGILSGAPKVRAMQIIAELAPRT